MKKFLITILSVLVFTGCSSTDNDKPPKIEKTYPSVSNFRFHEISELKEGNLLAGNYNTEGYVTHKSYCPPCPKGAMCEPCPSPRIVISEENLLIEGSPWFVNKTNKNTDLIIFANNEDQFEFNQRYIFSLSLHDFKTTDDENNDFELVGYDILQ